MENCLFRLCAGGKFLGSGVQVSRQHVLTCAHVVGRRREVEALLPTRPAMTGTVVEADHDENVDLALIELDTVCGEPPLWAQSVPHKQMVTLTGFVDLTGSRQDVQGEATPYYAGEWVERLALASAARKGMSGGVAVSMVGLSVRCVGLTRDGGESALQSVLAGPGKVARFLAKRGLVLPGCPALVEAVDPTVEIRKRYLAKLFQETGQIDIRGFQRSDGKAQAFPIEDLYIPLRNRDKNEIFEAVRKHRCLVVQGHAGSGKSTFLQWLAHALARAGELFPLPIRVAELDRRIQSERGQPGMPASDEDPRWLAVHLAAQVPDVEPAFLRAQLERPETVILLDGLDEALNDARRRSLATLFQNAAENVFPRCRFVLTTRPGAYLGESRARSFVVEEIADLEEAAVQKFIANWSRCVYPDNATAAEALRQDLEQQAGATEEVREMARNPMMLTALAAIHWNDRRLPHDRGELYESVITWMVRSREKRLGRVSEKRCRELLGALAAGMQAWPAGRLKQADSETAMQILGESMKLLPREAQEFLDQEQFDSGIIVSRSRDTVEFRHLTFQEYLAAQEVLENRSDAERTELLLSGRRRYAEEWREFLRLFAVLAKRRKALWLYSLLLGGAGESLADQARTVALVRLLVWDRKEQESDIEDARYLQFVRAMSGLFEGKADGQGLELWARGEAAKAWELLVADRSRLRLPSDEDYWVRVDGRFEIGRCPVTVHEYEQYLNWFEGAKAPDEWEQQQRFPMRPVVYVSAHDAEGYCAWWSGRMKRTIRLPLEDEWYPAAAGSGTKKREYPWGDPEPDADRANFGYEVKQPTPVGLFPAGATPDSGILDLAGNVWEWTASDWKPGDDRRVVRGGSFVVGARVLRAAVHDYVEPSGRGSRIGFRCVREVFS